MWSNGSFYWPNCFDCLRDVFESTIDKGVVKSIVE